MITLSPEAVKQINYSAKQSNSENMCLRIAAKVSPDESIDYGMGFDDAKDDDIHVTSHGVEIVIAPSNAELLNGMQVDYVELEPDHFHFIFKNPNDPKYKPPKEQ
ncbi:MAG: iron-sulfur cluster assembly accessory protein [Gammaproteobacteria bacterium]|nr:iron-sulfur cluster assembly accessory protein [Gammaproteobacteria bacterium]